MIIVKCDECGKKFNVHERFVRVDKKGFVQITAQLVYCPACPAEYFKGDTLDLVEVEGRSSGITFGPGSQITVHGDVVGGDKIDITIK